MRKRKQRQERTKRRREKRQEIFNLRFERLKTYLVKDFARGPARERLKTELLAELDKPKPDLKKIKNGEASIKEDIIDMGRLLQEINKTVRTANKLKIPVKELEGVRPKLEKEKAQTTQFLYVLQAYKPLIGLAD